MPAKARSPAREEAARRLATGVPSGKGAAWRRRLLGRGRPTCQPGQIRKGAITWAASARWGAERALEWTPRRGRSLSAREEAASAGLSRRATAAANNNARTRPSPVLFTNAPRAQSNRLRRLGDSKLEPGRARRGRRAHELAKAP